MNRPTMTAQATWQDLLASPDIITDLSTIYGADFLAGFANHFDGNPQPGDLANGVIGTAQAYVTGKWRKQAQTSKLLKYSGPHLIGAGMAARRLSAELAQLAKSKRATQAVQARLEAVTSGDALRYAQQVHQIALTRTGPQARLTAIQELATALEAAIADTITLPAKYEDESDAKKQALLLASDTDSAALPTLPKNYPMEEAAQAFKPVWEAFSSIAYRRGRYRHEIGGYNCKAGDALHEIIAKIDSTVALSLAGTAIENIRARPEAEKRSD